MTARPLPPSAKFCWPCGGRLVALLPHPDSPHNLYRPYEYEADGFTPSDRPHICYGPTMDLAPRSTR